MASIDSSSGLEAACLSLCRLSLEKQPSTALAQEAGPAQMKGPSGMPLQPFADLCRFMGRDAVPDKVSFGAGADAFGRMAGEGRQTQKPESHDQEQIAENTGHNS